MKEGAFYSIEMSTLEVDKKKTSMSMTQNLTVETHVQSGTHTTANKSMVSTPFVWKKLLRMGL